MLRVRQAESFLLCCWALDEIKIEGRLRFWQERVPPVTQDGWSAVRIPEVHRVFLVVYCVGIGSWPTLIFREGGADDSEVLIPSFSPQQPLVA